MPFPKPTDDPIVKRLRWIMIGAMLFSMFLTLAGQPDGFWQNPEAAIRGDGLGVHNPLNHTFEFFLSRGWQPYVLSCLIYFALAFVVVSVLPRKAALIAAFSAIFGHYFGACNWLAVHWGLGFTGGDVYSIVVSAAIIWAGSSLSAQSADQVIRRVRWVMLGVMLLDMSVTLIGQPSSYWHHPETVREGNSIWHWFMVRGWLDYVLADSVFSLIRFMLVSVLPRIYALFLLFIVILGHFIGVSNWLFYDWRLGIEAPVIYGVGLGSLIVFLSFRRRQKPGQARDKSLEPAAAPFAC